MKKRVEKKRASISKMTLEDLIEAAKKLPPMTDLERREQAASFAFGQIALTREWREKPVEDLAKLQAMCRKAAGLQ